MDSRIVRSCWIAAALLFAGAALIRINNAYLYPLHYGFDGPANFAYIERLMRSWALPAPGEGWSTSHPPFFYYLSAALGRALPGVGTYGVTVAARLLSSAIGLLGIAAAALLVWRGDPGNRGRALLAAALLLYLPVHVYMSAMLGEEIIAASLASIVLVGAAAELNRPASLRVGLLRMAGLGLLAGLAFLTKLTGLLVIATVIGAFAIDALRRRTLAPAIARMSVFALIAIVIGGWPYLRNKLEYGYFYPQNLKVHELMFTMPPGERGVMDYLRFPLATFLEPQVLAPDLIHSVWGTTYTTIYFDSHRVMLPRSEPAVERMGTALLLLGLLPSLAFGVGIARGSRRAIASPGGTDTLLLLMIAATLAGYVLFTWQNPWYATLKGSYLLGVAVPFAYYASEVLIDWSRALPGWRALLIWLPLAALLFGSVASFTVNLVWVKREGPGFVWPRVDPSRHYQNMLPNPNDAGGTQ